MIQKLVKALIVTLTLTTFIFMGSILKHKWDTHMPVLAKEQCVILMMPNVGLVKAIVIENDFANGLTYIGIYQPSQFLLAGAIPVETSYFRDVGFIRIECGI